MDIITDLTSQSVSYIVIIQDICRKFLQQKQEAASESLRLWEIIKDEQEWSNATDKVLRIRLKDISWITNPHVVHNNSEFDRLTYQIYTELTNWLQKHLKDWPEQSGMDADILQITYGTIYTTPYEWRKMIRKILYNFPSERIALAGILHYLPIQVIFATGGKNEDVYNQRIYQVWDQWEAENHGNRPSDKKIDSGLLKQLLCENDHMAWTKWWNSKIPLLKEEKEKAEASEDQEHAQKIQRVKLVTWLLKNEKDLRTYLKASENPVPFETIFPEELDEIERSRAERGRLNKERWKTRRNIDPFKNCHFADLAKKLQNNKKLTPNSAYREMTDASERFSVELAIESLAGFPIEKNNIPAPPLAHNPLSNTHEDPLDRAQRLRLIGLAFSGGGIRSATFNLGVLQHLAERNILSHVDYLSTVSGGGYIGSWVASWIKRSGSVHKVEDRINPSQSMDPMAEEVRPIRWLRMYSNYLTPNASIMSVDSWTLGVTWLRNTLINQLLLLLLLCSCLSGIILLFTTWAQIGSSPGTLSPLVIALGGFGLLTPGCFVAGIGMKTYNKEQRLKALANWGRHRHLSLVLIGLAILSACLISSWMYSRVMTEIGTNLHVSYYERLNVLLPAAEVGGLSILLIAFIGRYYDTEESNSNVFPYITIVVSSLFAAALGWVLMAGLWHLYFQIARSWRVDHQAELLFTIGIPLILEIFSVVVVVRMALMGRLFPDERREWWGRMGAIAHRFSLIWLVMCIAGLFLLDIFQTYANNNEKILPTLLPVLGGWAGIVGFGVKLAYSSTNDKDKGIGGFKEFFIRFVPYLFMIGFVLGACYLLAYITDLYGQFRVKKNTPIDILFITAFFTFLAVVFSWRVGVNEFSLHYFYRNRLVRAYLGATKGRAERSKTANSFTGLDVNDDEKLEAFTTEKGYYGPYPLLNSSLNATSITELDRQDRKAESFLFSPLFCGFDFSPTRSSSYNRVKGFEYGYRPTNKYGYKNGPTVGTAMAISGAAVSPNMGYHSTSATAFLLTVFNVRLGWWMGNPRMDTWKNSDPKLGLAYIINDMTGRSSIESNYVCLSDGGHFDNMGLYELIRRRCTYIILSDAEEDQGATCEGLANAVRRCRIDFGVDIQINTSEASSKKTSHVVKGSIKYPGDKTPSGTLIYIKTVVTGDESTDIKEYQSGHAAFPNESTGDQFFDEAQFESYRQLGYHSLSTL